LATRDRFGDLPRRTLRTSEWGSVVICSDPILLAEEAPGAYKDIDRVVRDLVDAHLVTPVVATVPVVTYKTERGGAGPDAREARQKDRAAARDRSARRRETSRRAGREAR
jgi:release factor H-coupled RctB family protein